VRYRSRSKIMMRSVTAQLRSHEARFPISDLFPLAGRAAPGRRLCP
jgi:hypothetical protein